jgi:type IV secretory pathway TraG/TraD family ATPase VirD4
MAFADPQQAVLVLGPPRSGKTTALVIPNVLAAPGAVISTSTKLDVMGATVRTRSALGRCWLLDPTGTVPAPAGVTPLRWSPAMAATDWDESLITSRAMVTAARPGATRGEAAHWTERAEALVAPLLHAAAIGGADMRTVARWVLRQDLDPARAILTGHGVALAADVLAGLAATDPREMSGIWSTAAGVLSAYRSEAALAAAEAPNLDPRSIALGTDTVYVCAPARSQALVAPIVVAFLEQVRAGAYRAAGRRSTPDAALPVTLALDELANIAPLPDLPAMVSEGGGQGVLTLACLQDLSQARARWAVEAEGFMSLFGTKVVLPGIGDLATLELVSRLGGEVDVPHRSISQGPWWGPGRGAATVSWVPRRQRRLPVDAVNQLATGTAVVLAGRERPAMVRLPPWWAAAPFAPHLSAALPGCDPPGGAPSPARAPDRAPDEKKAGAPRTRLRARGRGVEM